ncbi:MAG: hypothetical protein LBD75_04195 [Candidatus Peribacteria bacterium]|jgi:hypothetical protein|nr:hypothetical protein [Candidatus Peribacteria bacterium]
MSTKHLHLTPDDKKQIEAITATITTIPREFIQATKEGLFLTLENGNPLNRLIRDPETKNIIGFLAVEEYTDNQGKKIGYLRATALLPREQRAIKMNLDEEVEKLITRAQQK